MVISQNYTGSKFQICFFSEPQVIARLNLSKSKVLVTMEQWYNIIYNMGKRVRRMKAVQINRV